MLAEFVLASSDQALIQRWQSLAVPCQRFIVCADYQQLALLAWPAPSCCVLDVEMGAELEHHEQWRHLSREVSLCLFAPAFTIEAELHWLSSGIRACCTPDLDDERLKTIVEVTAQGGIWVSQHALPQLMQGLQRYSQESHLQAGAKTAMSSLSVLTPQERKIAQLVGQGESNKLIARALNISDHTVKTHLSAIFSKLHLSDRVHLALLVNQDPENRP
ncbi:response regulator transcription factor [Chitinibacter sp. SCUT-21]|uniref:helix-turn-helix transcriptional regulator n=1 Tax=Chitinibacter sp. SCUT-21 TaxID=2970891 RepID=UPI0035A73D92